LSILELSRWKCQFKKLPQGKANDLVEFSGLCLNSKIFHENSTFYRKFSHSNDLLKYSNKAVKEILITLGFILFYFSKRNLHLVYSLNARCPRITDTSGTQLVTTIKASNQVLLRFAKNKYLLFFPFKITGSNFRSLSKILNCDLKKFCDCFSANRAKFSWKPAKNPRRNDI